MSDPDPVFAAVVSAINPHLFPPADAEDLASGATWIPGTVTDARRAGEVVGYVRAHCPYWQFPDGRRVSMDRRCVSCAAEVTNSTAIQPAGPAAPPVVAALNPPVVAEIDIAGIDKVVIAYELIAGANLSPLHLIEQRTSSKVPERVMASYMLRKSLNLGWFCGRAIMTDLTGDALDPRYYDMFNGAGAAQAAVDRARAVSPAAIDKDAVYRVTLDGWRTITPDAQGVCILVDVHYVERGTPQTRSIGFGPGRGILPTFWMVPNGQDLPRFFWQAVSWAVNASGVQAKILSFSLGSPEPGNLVGKYVRPSGIYDPHVTLYPRQGVESAQYEYQRWAAIDRVLTVGTFSDEEYDRRTDSVAVNLCVRYFAKEFGEAYVREPAEILSGNSWYEAHRAALQPGSKGDEAMFLLLQIASRLVIDAMAD